MKTKTIPVRRRLTLLERKAAAEYPERPGMDYLRPRLRSECQDGPRPCPFVSCQHHLYLDVMPNGSIKFNFPDVAPEDMPESCELDVADRGSQRLIDVGAVMNLTRERVRQVEETALAKVRAHLQLGTDVRSYLDDAR